MACGIDVPNCSVRQKNPILVEAIYSFAERLLKSLVYPNRDPRGGLAAENFCGSVSSPVDPIRKFGTSPRSSRAPFGCRHPKPNCPCGSASALRLDKPHFAIGSLVPISVGSRHQLGTRSGQ